MIDICYVPVVKAKRNDLAALSDLRDATKTHVRPLIELAGHIVYDVNEEIDQISQRVAGFNWPNRPYVDLYAFLPDAITDQGENATVAGFRKLRTVNANFIPTYGRQRNDDIWDALRAIAANSNGEFCFRVDIDDLDDQSEDTWHEIVERCAQLAVAPAKFDIILDLRSVTLVDAPTLREQVIEFLALQPTGFMPRQIVVVGSSALLDVTSVPKNGVGVVPRKELHVWAQVTNELAGTRALGFGDYGIVHPNFLQDGPRPNANAKVRYSAGASTYYFRGICLKDPPKYGQYYALAKKVIASAQYCGQNFSVGDERIWQCAKGGGGTGNLSTWAHTDQNHHFELVSRQILKLRQRVVDEKPSKIADLVESA